MPLQSVKSISRTEYFRSERSRSHVKERNALQRNTQYDNPLIINQHLRNIISRLQSAWSRHTNLRQSNSLRDGIRLIQNNFVFVAVENILS